IAKSPEGGGSLIRVRIAIACAAVDTKQSDVATRITEAVDAAKAGTHRRDLDWPLLSLITCGLRAGVTAGKLDPVVSYITDKQLAAWGKLLLLRERLAKSRSAEPAEAVESIPAKSLAGMLARLEWARHNAYHNRGSVGNLSESNEGLAALVSMGVAL